MLIFIVLKWRCCGQERERVFFLSLVSSKSPCSIFPLQYYLFSMATFNHLPIRVLKSILSFLVYNRAQNLREWKKKLPVIGVCQLWRYFGLDLVYNQAFFVDYDVYIKQDKTLRKRRGQHLLQHSLPNAKPILVSNIDLLIIVDRCYTVQRMDIVLYHLKPHHMFLDEVFRIFQQTRGEWFRVNYLRVDQRAAPGDGDFFDYYLADIKDREYDLGPIVEYAKSNLTAITDLLVDVSDTLIGRLSMRLQVLYSDYLHGFLGNISVLTSIKYLPEKITRLNIAFDRTDEILYLPIVFSESLISMTLDNLPPSFDWMCFRNPIGIPNTIIAFKSIRYISISFSSNHGDDKMVCDRPGPLNEFYMKLAFPSLSDLYITDCSTNNAFLHAEFPNKVDKVEYKGSMSSIVLCQQIKIKCKRLVIIVTSANKIEETDFYKTMNNLLVDGDNNKASLTFSLSNMLFTIDIESIRWDNLYQLDIGFYIDFKSFIQLLRMLPNLKRMILQDDPISGILETLDYGFVNSMKNFPDFVLCSKLESMRFSGERDPYKLVEMLDLIKSLISCCPCLIFIYTEYLLKDELEKFIQNPALKIYRKKFFIYYRCIQ